MLLATIRGTKQRLSSLSDIDIHMHRCGIRRIPGALIEVTIAVHENVIPLLAMSGYEFTIQGDVHEILSQRLAPVSPRAADFGSARALFHSVAANGAYMDTAYLGQWTANLADLFPDFCTLIPLPHITWEGRATSAVRLRAGDADHRLSILFTSGVHAGELGGPDSCIYFLYRLINSYLTGAPIVLGETTFNEHHVQDLMAHLDLFVVPCMNPDGRVYVETSKNWWRKNRNPTLGVDAIGVDINRNFDFLWSSGIGSSAHPSTDIYQGAAPFSEPESRNVQWLLETSRADLFVDIHGPSETLVYSWGDAHGQSLDPSMNFHNAAWDGKRHSPYGEYLPAADGNLLRQLGTTMVDAANAVHDGAYICGQSFDALYATSGTADDYAYSLHFIDGSRNKTYAYTFEYGGGSFFPPYDEMQHIIDEVNAAMLALCDEVTAPVR
jgi:murein tripeptide amidase MpaA